MKSVWLVTSGDYSDYSVWCAFETEELANAYCDAYMAIGKDMWDAPGVERCQLWDAVPVVTRVSREFGNPVHTEGLKTLYELRTEDEAAARAAKVQ